MFDHVTIRVSDRAASERFYDTVLATIGLAKAHSSDQVAEWGEFSVSPATAEKPPTRRLHVGFTAPSRAHVDEFWRVGTAAGYRDDGAPGPRPQYSSDYYGAFLLDPDGNSAEAVHHDDVSERGIDHVWIRVADVAAAKRFYETVAPQTGFRLANERPGFAHFNSRDGSFSLVLGTPSQHVHLAFGTTDDAVVHEFHRVALAAGYRDNGGPGERSIYHPGYYAAFVCDPAGNNVEVVNHNRS